MRKKPNKALQPKFRTKQALKFSTHKQVCLFIVFENYLLFSKKKKTRKVSDCFIFFLKKIRGESVSSGVIVGWWMDMCTKKGTRGYGICNPYQGFTGGKC